SWRGAGAIGRCSTFRRSASARRWTRRACRMTSSRKPDDLPPAWGSMWRLCRLGLRYEPSLMTWSFVLALVAAVPDALIALWFKLMADAIGAGDATKLRL